MSAVDRATWIALALTERVGIRTIAALFRHFDGDAEALFAAPPADLRHVPGVGPKIAAALARIDQDGVARRLAAWEQAGVLVLTWAHDRHRYPQALLSIADPPAALFIRGALSALDQPAVALVGTRQPTSAGADAALQIAYELAAHGVAIISGLARGVDAAAHRGALGARGISAGVLGGGVLRIYPPEHESLAEALLIGGGALLAESAPDAPPSSPRLVARNRLITGLCRAVLIVETGVEGGAMHAARRAREQGRAVFALDTPAAGNRALLNDGALPLCPDDLAPLLDYFAT